MSETPDPGAPAPAPTPTLRAGGTNDSFAWALLLSFVAGMGILAFHNVPKEQLTIFSGMLGAVAGAGVTKFIEFVWGASKHSSAVNGSVP